MNADQTSPSSHQPPSAAVLASAKPLHSNRANPFPPATNAAAATTAVAADTGDMAATGFLPMSQAFRPLPPAQSPYPLNMSTAHLFEREPAKPVGAPFSNSPSCPMVRVLIRRLPLNTSEESLRLMVVWSKELANVELLPIDKSEDEGFRSALLRFRTIAGAMEAKNMLDGRSNISNDAEMIVEILPSSPVSARRHVAEPPSSSATSSTASAAAPGPRQPSRFNTVFSPMDKISPTSHGAFPAHDFLNNDPSVGYQNIFSPQSPIGSHLSERPRISGKTLISNDFGDDEETSDLLKDPVAYAENGASSQRRATAPQIPVSRMASLSLNTSNPPGPSSLPQYMTPLSPINGTSGPPSGLGYPVGGHGYQQRHNFPPVNPADQNPPCNTLYVGNLPIDTSEEELKAMFSKQRGYKRLCFRTKQNGPMCFVEFEDISFATKALHELYGHPLHNSVKGGIRLSFSKNPLGVRSGQGPGQGSSGSAGGVNGIMAGLANGFTTAHGPPPGLAAPPGLGSGRGGSYNLAASMNTGGNHSHQATVSGFPGAPNHPWNAPAYNNGVAAGPHAPLHANSPYLSRHMMGR